MKNKSYSEKLTDPRWQKKRLGIFERDKFTCQKCGDKTSTLHVHHHYYKRGLEPWDYPDCDLITYCFKCHQYEHVEAKSKKKLKIYLAGKIEQNCWRHEIVKGLRSATPDDVICGEDCDVDKFPSIIEGAVFCKHDYTGPFFVSCDHGCFHGENTHGSSAASHESNLPSAMGQVNAYYRALDGIASCDLFFAWIDSLDCFGTLFEIGYATAIGKRVVVCTKLGFNSSQLWFSKVSAEVMSSENPKDGLLECLQLKENPLYESSPI